MRRTTPQIDRALFDLYRNLKPGDKVTVEKRQPSYRNSEQSKCGVPEVFLESGAIAEVISVKVPCVKASANSYMNKFVHVSFSNPDDLDDKIKHSAGLSYKDIVLVKKA